MGCGGAGLCGVLVWIWDWVCVGVSGLWGQGVRGSAVGEVALSPSPQDSYFEPGKA